MITPPSTFRFCTGAPRYDDWLVMIRAARGRNSTSSRMAAHLRDWGRRNPRCRRRWAQRSTSARLADHCPQLIKHWGATAPSSGLVRSRTLRCLPNVASGTGQGRVVGAHVVFGGAAELDVYRLAAVSMSQLDRAAGLIQPADGTPATR